jgi:hypothetical protein
VDSVADGICGFPGARGAVIPRRAGKRKKNTGALVKPGHQKSENAKKVVQPITLTFPLKPTFKGFWQRMGNFSVTAVVSKT